MSDALPIPAEVIEKAVDAWADVYFAGLPQDAIRNAEPAMEAAIRTTCKKMGLRVQREGREYRYISDWRPVEVESDE